MLDPCLLEKREYSVTGMEARVIMDLELKELKVLRSCKVDGPGKNIHGQLISGLDSLSALYIEIDMLPKGLFCFSMVNIFLIGTSDPRPVKR